MDNGRKTATIFTDNHLNEELVPPAVEGLEGVGRRDVVGQDAAVGAAVESHAQRLEPLLAGRVPDLHGDQSVVDHHLLGQEISPDCGFVLVGEFLVDVLVHQGGLADARVSKNDNFE